MKLRDRLARFFQNRNGADQLSRTFTWAAFAIVILSFLVSPLLNGILSIVLWVLALLCLVYSYRRIFSKDINKRRSENARYLTWKDGKKAQLRKRKTQFQQRKDYRFFTCPQCKTTLRIPRGKGTVQITCRQCGNKFRAKS